MLVRFFNAAGGNRTLVTGLENLGNGRYTTAAKYYYEKDK